MTKLIVGAVVFGGLFLNNIFAAMVVIPHGQYPLDPRYTNALKTAGINCFLEGASRDVPNMSYTNVFDINMENQAGYTVRINHYYKNHMQIQKAAWAPHFPGWIFRNGWSDGVPYDALIDGNGNTLPYGCLSTYDGIAKLVPALDTVQKYCDFYLENYIKPMIKARYEQGVYMFIINQEDYWRYWQFEGNPQYTLSKFFPLHDYHEYDGLSLAEKEKRMREVVMMFYKKLYEWKNDNYPKVILTHSLACGHNNGTNGTMLKSMQDIPWVDWFGMNGGSPMYMVGASSNGIEAPANDPGRGSPYPMFKQMIETNYFEYLNADGVVENRQSRGWGIAQTESDQYSFAPGTPEQFLKLPEQYSNTRYYDNYTVNVPEQYYLQSVFQKIMSEWSALDRGNNYIKLHSLFSFVKASYFDKWISCWIFPTSCIDDNLPAGARYFTDQVVENNIEDTVKSGVIWIDNFNLTKDGVSVCQEGNFETIPSLAWDINKIKSVVTTNRTYWPPVYTVVTSALLRTHHSANLGVDGSGGIASSNTLRLASQVCGNALGNTRLDFSIMAKGTPTLAGNNPMLGIYWEGYDVSGNLLEKGKALSDSTPDGKFWYVPLTNQYQNFSGYILNNNPATDHVKVSIYNAFPLNKVPFLYGGPLIAAAYCFNGPYGHDETTNRFTYWNKVTKSNETASTSKYMFLRDEMMTPGGKLYDTWGNGGTQWPLVVKKDGIAYDPDTGRITINLRNMCAENSISAPIHIFRRDKGAGPAWNTNLYVKATPANIDNSLISADRIAYVGLNSYSVPGPTSSTDDPLTSSDNSVALTVTLTNAVANGQRIYIYIQDTESVKGWTAFNDLPECSGALQEGANDQVRITINATDEDGIKSTELEYSINNQNIWYPLDSSNSGYLEAYYDLGEPYLITFRARAVDIHDLSSNWIYLEYQRRINLVENGDFEQGTTNWHSQQNGQVLAISSNAPLSGNSSLKVTMPGIVMTEGICSSVGCPVEKGKTYIASAYVKCDPDQQGKVKICLLGTKGGWTYANQVTELNSGWQKISVTKTITEDNETLYIAVLTWEVLAINLYVDRIELMEVKDYKTVYNGDFELGTAGWGSQQSGQVLTNSPCALSGNLSLKVTTPGIKITEGICSRVGYQVEKGKTYIASAYVKCDPSQQGKVKICLAGTKGGWTYANQVAELGTFWQKISVTKTITATNESLHIAVLTWDTPQAINLYVDRIELMEVKDYEMVYNGDFEQDMTGWGSQQNGQVLALSPYALSGNLSLKVTTPGIVPTEGICSSVGYQVEKGKTYTASACVRCDPSQQGKVRICLAGTKGGWTYANQTTELNAGWQKISVTKTIIATNESLHLTVLTWDEPQAINLYVDRIELIEGVLEENRTVGNWKLDEGAGTTASDSSGTGNNGILQGNPQWTSGWINGALSFNGSNYVDCGSNSSLKVSAITMEAWVYSPTTNFSGPNEIAGAEGAYGYNITDNKIWVHINTVNQGWHWCVSSTALTWNGWHHIAFTYDGVNTVKCYRDGVLILTDTTSSSGNLQWAAPKLYIGQVNTGSRLFKGTIDEVKIYNHPLTAAEITNEWQNRPVGNWKLDEDAGTTASDSSGTGNNGTLQGNPQWVNGWINGALSFNGSNYVDCGSNSSLKVAVITMEAWVYSPTTNFSGPNEIAGAEGAYGFNITDNK
ncbi:MAG: carbohydrate binding domain-containing protein, partial [Verrucomicrobia bacterium]|nr:carbohydrate binding domain-containing protein [Verrucomicrobiota bacterium]